MSAPPVDTEPGQLWELPGGHRALQMDFSTRNVLRVARIVPGRGWLAPVQEVDRRLCRTLPMRYHGAPGGTP